MPSDWLFSALTAKSLVIAIVLPFILTWLVTLVQSWTAVAAAKRAPEGEKRPPTLPTAIPLLGHIIPFMRDGHGFLSSAV